MKIVGIPCRMNAKEALFAGIYWSGLAGLYMQLARSTGAVVLMYHSVVTPAESRWIHSANSVTVSAFESQMRFLSRRRRVVSMSELVDTIKRGDRIAPGTVVLTFDDGYVDNLRNAAPILGRYGLPATLYIPTGLVDRHEAQWIDRLYSFVKTRTANGVDVHPIGRFNLADPEQNVSFMRAATDHLLVADRTIRESILRAVHAQLKPAMDPPRLTMNWDEVREWSRFPGLEVGAHTEEHLDLSSCSPDLAFAEISRSVNRVREVLNQPVKHFSFPYGRSTSQTREMVWKAGLESAVASAPDPRVRDNTELNWIPRVAAPASPTLFRFFTSPAYPDLPIRLINRA